MQDSAHILVVDDELATRKLLVSYFESEGYRVSQLGDGDQVVSTTLSSEIDLLLLDIRLPHENGLELTKKLRRVSDVGIILVTVKSDVIDRIVGLEMGADDYVTKPFNPRELFARSKNLIRRVKAARASGADANSKSIKFEGWHLDLWRHQLLQPDGLEIPLTEGEYNILAALATRSGRIVSREQLLDVINHRAWNPADRTIDVMIGKIRKKMNDNPSDPRFIRTVRGAGYMFAPKVTADHAYRQSQYPV